MAMPKLRFKEFEYEYKNTSFEKLEGFSIQSGKSNNKADSGDYPFYGSTGIIGFSSSYDYVEKAILIARVGANAGSLYQVDGKYSVSDNTLIFRVSNSNNLNYLRELLIKFDLNRLVFGTGQPLVTGGMIKKVNISIPELTEQTKNASFLSAVDEKISQLNQKHDLLSQYKQGMMQKLFSQQIRFKADDGRDFGEWEEIALGKIKGVSIASGKSSYEKLESAKYYYYGSTGVIGYSNEYDYQGTKILIARVGHNAGYIYMVTGKYNVSDNTLILELPSNLNYIFIRAFLEKIQLNKLVFGTGQPLITGGLLKKVVIQVPCLEEQTKIANFLSVIDQKVENVAQQIEETKQWKKGLLQQMFV